MSLPIKELKIVLNELLIEAYSPYHNVYGEQVSRESLKGQRGSYSKRAPDEPVEHPNIQRKLKGWNKKTKAPIPRIVGKICGAEARMRGGNVRCYDGAVIVPVKRGNTDPDTDSCYYLRKLDRKNLPARCRWVVDFK